MITDNVYRDKVIEEIALMLQQSYPDHVSTNAFCAAIRSMKSKDTKRRAS